MAERANYQISSRKAPKQARSGALIAAALHAAVAVRPQSDEWHDTSEMLRIILEDDAVAPLARLRSLVYAFIRSECDEAQVRVALNDVAPFYRDAPGANETRAAGSSVILRFLTGVLPGTDIATCEIVADLMETTLSEVGSSFSEAARSDAEIITYADAMADMFCTYMHSLAYGQASIVNGIPTPLPAMG